MQTPSLDPAAKGVNRFLALLAVFLLFFLCTAGCSRKQADSRKYTVGVVNLNPELEKVLQGFKEKMTRLGYVENKNIVYIYNGPRKSIEDLEKDLDLFVTNRVDLVLAITTPAARMAKEKTRDSGVPVVFAPVFDPVGSGIVESLVQPGGNVTGIKVGGNVEKALDWFLKIIPGIKNLYVPFSSNNRATELSLMELREAAAKFGVSLNVREVKDTEELEAALATIPETIDGIWLLNSHFLVTHTPLFVAASIKFKLPLGSSTFQVDDGVLVSYGQNSFRTGELAAGLANDILQGISPRELPVETTDFFLGINLKTAKAIDIDISDDILHVADTIISP